MTNGHCRITVLDQKGHAYVQDVEAGDLWFFPAGMPHSLEGIGANGCEFLIAFDDGKASEFNTLLVTDWMAHTPPDILAMNFDVPADTFKSIPLNDLWIFQGKEPGPLADDKRAVAAGGPPPFPFTFKMGASTPVKSNRSGTIQVVDSTTFKASTTTSAALVTLKPGAMREMHWHPNADEWQYWIKGEGRMGVFKAGPNVQTQDFRAGDIGYIPRNQGHYLQNTGTTDLQVLALFRAPSIRRCRFRSGWCARRPRWWRNISTSIRRCWRSSRRTPRGSCRHSRYPTQQPAGPAKNAASSAAKRACGVRIRRVQIEPRPCPAVFIGKGRVTPVRSGLIAFIIRTSPCRDASPRREGAVFPTRMSPCARFICRAPASVTDCGDRFGGQVTSGCRHSRHSCRSPAAAVLQFSVA